MSQVVQFLHDVAPSRRRTNSALSKPAVKHSGSGVQVLSSRLAQPQPLRKSCPIFGPCSPAPGTRLFCDSLGVVGVETVRRARMGELSRFANDLSAASFRRSAQRESPHHHHHKAWDQHFHLGREPGAFRPDLFCAGGSRASHEYDARLNAGGGTIFPPPATSAEAHAPGRSRHLATAHCTVAQAVQVPYRLELAKGTALQFRCCAVRSPFWKIVV
jgi:hypothetical protein